MQHLGDQVDLVHLLFRGALEGGLDGAADLLLELGSRAVYQVLVYELRIAAAAIGVIGRDSQAQADFLGHDDPAATVKFAFGGLGQSTDGNDGAPGNRKRIRGQAVLHNGYAKVEIGLAKGKKIYDKRKSIMERDVKREVAREMAAR